MYSAATWSSSNGSAATINSAAAIHRADRVGSIEPGKQADLVVWSGPPLSNFSRPQETWIDGRWVTLDATPPTGDSSPFRTRTGTIGLYADWLRQRWDKYVVNYSMRMQADAVKEGVRAVRRTGTAFRFRGWDGIGGTARRAFGRALPSGHSILSEK